MSDFRWDSKMLRSLFDFLGETQINHWDRAAPVSLSYLCMHGNQFPILGLSTTSFSVVFIKMISFVGNLLGFLGAFL